jgi:hypothetical protein
MNITLGCSLASDFYAEAECQCGPFFSNRSRYRFQSGFFFFYVRPYVDIAELLLTYNQFPIDFFNKNMFKLNNASDFNRRKRKTRKPCSEHSMRKLSMHVRFRSEYFFLPYRTRILFVSDPCANVQRFMYMSFLFKKLMLAP